MRPCITTNCQNKGVRVESAISRLRTTAHRPASTRGPCSGRGRQLCMITFAAKGGKSTAAKGFGAPKPQTKGIADGAQCPCGSGALYESCCAVYHRGGAASVPSPEALLRSRYSAYVAKEPTYIADTTHPDSPEYTGSRASYIGTVKNTMRRLDPQRLTILQSEPGAGEGEAFISFRLKRRISPEVAGTAAEVDEITERSRFVRVNNRWFYMDSEFLNPEGGKDDKDAAAAPAAAAPEAPKKQPGFKLPFFS